MTRTKRLLRDRIAKPGAVSDWLRCADDPLITGPSTAAQLELHSTGDVHSRGNPLIFNDILSDTVGFSLRLHWEHVFAH